MVSPYSSITHNSHTAESNGTRIPWVKMPNLLSVMLLVVPVRKNSRISLATSLFLSLAPHIRRSICRSHSQLPLTHFWADSIVFWHNTTPIQHRRDCCNKILLRILQLSAVPIANNIEKGGLSTIAGGFCTTLWWQNILMHRDKRVSANNYKWSLCWHLCGISLSELLLATVS